MTGASIETTLELWASSLREVKIRMRQLFAQERAALNAGLIVDGCLATSVAKPYGCARRQRAILGLGGSRRFWAVTGGMPMRCVTWCATMSPSILRTITRCW
jgi:hypothetical protein